MTFNAPDASAAGRSLSTELAAAEGVDEVTWYWKVGSPPSLRADDSSSALVLAGAGGEDGAAEATVQRVRERLDGDQGALTVEIGGAAAIGEALGHGLEQDLVLAEMIAIPLTLLLLRATSPSGVAGSAGGEEMNILE